MHGYSVNHIGVTHVVACNGGHVCMGWGACMHAWVFLATAAGVTHMYAASGDGVTLWGVSPNAMAE